MPKSDDFRTELDAQIARATRQDRPHVEVNAGELHRVVGSYPGDHRMPDCRGVMRREFQAGNATIMFQTESGDAAALTICYGLPR